jgi:starch synthase
MIISTEFLPLVKRGGLGDITYSLLSKLPQYNKYQIYYVTFNFSQIKKSNLAITTIYSDELFQIYLTEAAGPYKLILLDFTNNPINWDDPYFTCTPRLQKGNLYLLFSHACYLLIKHNILPIDLIHIHDWYAGLLPLFLKATNRFYPPVILTVHNAAYQGAYPLSYLTTNLPQEFNSFDFTPYLIDGQYISLIGIACIFADLIVFPSHNYQTEIMNSATNDLLKLLHKFNIKHKSISILNGIDYTIWNPELDCTSPDSVATYFKCFPKKSYKRAYLKNRFRVNNDEFVWGFIGRFAAEKGIFALLEIVQELPGLGILATPTDQEIKLPRNVLLISNSYNMEELIALLWACDVILMPSYFEPCGLVQLQAMRYGALPIVRRVGGLAETVIDIAHNPAQGTGFLFNSDEELLPLVKHAHELYLDYNQWEKWVFNCLSQNYSDKKMVVAYAALYDKTLNAAE